jgi:DNA-directed RNA polymerase specialized sigma24 family protein
MESVYTVQSLPEAIADHYEYIRRVAYRLTRDMDRLDDYVQASYVACIERIDVLSRKPDYTFKQHIAQTTVFTIRTIRKSEQRLAKRLSDNAILGSIFASLPDRDTRKQIKLAWSKLSKAHRKTLREHFAGKLGNDGATRKRLCLARKSLSQLMLD